MATVTYTVIDGEVVSENRNGVERDYVTDPSGNVVALLDEDQNITDTFEYGSFGDLQARTGTTPTPFQFGGGFGYYTDANGTIYVRRRQLDPQTGRWMTVDPIWPGESAYVYAWNNPATFSDPSGLSFLDCPADHPVREAWKELQRRIKEVCSGGSGAVANCFRKCKDSQAGKEGECLCKHGSGASGYNVKIICRKDAFCSLYGIKCMDTEKGGWYWDCKISVCSNCPAGIDYQSALLHELMHCCGVAHWKPPSSRPGGECDADCLENCLRGLFGFVGPAPNWDGILG